MEKYVEDKSIRGCSAGARGWRVAGWGRKHSRLQLAAGRERRSAKRPERELGQRWPAAADAEPRGGADGSGRRWECGSSKRPGRHRGRAGPPWEGGEPATHGWPRDCDL